MRFDRKVAPGGYAWWYIDAVSDDGAQALTIIGFIGSVFSPYYAWANAKRPAQAENFCAMNVALYQPRGGYWAMTERGAAALRRRESEFEIGPSAMRWEDGRLVLDICERCAPVPRRLRGRVILTPGTVRSQVHELDPGGRHRWQPIAPQARVEVLFQAPDMRWSGNGYFDHNEGDVPLAEDFSEWHWSRGEDMILYDVTYKNGERHGLALRDGVAFAPPPERALPRTFWRVDRVTRADAGFLPRVVKTLEDSPFYARSLVETQIGGNRLVCVHESLSLARFSAPWVRVLLPFRMPRLG